MNPLIMPLLSFGGELIDKFFPNEEDRLKAQATLLKMQQHGELQEYEVRMSAILAEAKSNDKWVSRARPTFLYVIYVMILAAIPMGIMAAFYPDLVHSIEAGMKSWLTAIPDALWGMFGAGYLGYTASRSYDKKQMLRSKHTWTSKE